MATLRSLQAEISSKIHAIIDDIDSLESLTYIHENLNFESQILILGEEKNSLIDTQNYLEKCEFKLGNTIKKWLENDCKGEIQISLKGEK